MKNKHFHEIGSNFSGRLHRKQENLRIARRWQLPHVENLPQGCRRALRWPSWCRCQFEGGWVGVMPIWRSDGIVKLMRSQVGPSSVELKTLADYDKFIKNEEPSVIGASLDSLIDYHPPMRLSIYLLEVSSKATASWRTRSSRWPTPSAASTASPTPPARTSSSASTFPSKPAGAHPVFSACATFHSTGFYTNNSSRRSKVISTYLQSDLKKSGKFGTTIDVLSEINFSLKYFHNWETGRGHNNIF